MSEMTEAPLTAGRDAARRNDWQEAFELLSNSERRTALEPEDLEELAQAAWWTGRLDACISARERAFAAYLAVTNNRRAAVVAMALAKDYYAKGSSPIGTAWVKRAEALLTQEPECAEHGQLERLRAVIAHEGLGDFDEALERSRRALELATRFGNRDLEAVALHDQGRALVAKGQVAEGMAMIDEATVAAVSGELSPFNTAVIYCNTITACTELADYRRAADWTDAAKRWCERQAITGFPGMCRVYRASIMALRGAWPEAEQEARLACDELRQFNLSYAAEAFYELGELRMRTGDLSAAEDAFKQANELGRDPQPGFALLRLAEGNTNGASTCIAHALEDESRDLHRARLLPAQVQIAIAASELEKARAATDELDAIAKTYGSDALEALSHTARSRLALAEGDSGAAVREGRQALRAWQGIDAPYEAAEVRVLLASGYLAHGNSASAVLELEASVTAFDRLGAELDARRARRKLEVLGASAEPLSAGDDRATRTFMFTDIVRSTNLVEAIGDENWAALVRWHDETLRSLFAAHQGEEIDHAGDGFFVAFGTPEAGIGCSVAIQRRLAKHRREHGFSPQVRIGLHTAEATRAGLAYRGKGVHEAARIAAHAAAGEILASRRTLAAGPERFMVCERRSLELEGISQPVEVATITWE
jgi:class 3 adenylate cyclase